MIGPGADANDDDYRNDPLKFGFDNDICMVKSPALSSVTTLSLDLDGAVGLSYDSDHSPILWQFFPPPPDRLLSKGPG